MLGLWAKAQSDQGAFLGTFSYHLIADKLCRPELFSIQFIVNQWPLES